jgi:hypothetical protein
MNKMSAQKHKEVKQLQLLQQKKAAQVLAVKKFAKTCAKVMVESSVGKWLATTVKETAALSSSMVTTTVAFGTMVQVTLWLDEHWLHHLFLEFAEVDPTVGTMFKFTKYLALALELGWWVRGVYLDCKQHSNHKHSNQQNHNSAAADEVKKDDEGSENH